MRYLLMLDALQNYFKRRQLASDATEVKNIRKQLN